MKTFNDAAGRSWTITLNLGTAMAVKVATGVDLLQPEAGVHCVEADIGNGRTVRRWQMRDEGHDEFKGPKGTPLLTRLGTDEMLLGEVLCALLAGQFEAHGLSENDVRAGFDGATLLAAQRAFYEELIDFFQQRGGRKGPHSQKAAPNTLPLRPCTRSWMNRPRRASRFSCAAQTIE